MAYRIQHHSLHHHPLARPEIWLGHHNLEHLHNCFVEKDHAARLARKENKTQDDWLTDVRFGEAHISDIGEVVVKPDKYQLVLDMFEFKPEEVTIRAVHNGFYVRAVHPDIVDGKEYITKHFYREYVLPHDIDPKDAKSWMTPGNILFIEAPKIPFEPNHPEDATVKEVQVVRQAEL